MLVGESERLDLESLGVSEEAIEVEAEGVRGELGVEPGAEAPERVGLMGGEAELLRQLVVDRLDDLAGAIEQTGRRGGQLAVLVATRYG